jgi:hypothetical protein
MEAPDQIRYPLGKMPVHENITPEMLNSWFETIGDLPDKLSNLIEDLNPTMENARYREGGWTIRQLVHHMADSHVNAYIRLKLALTEDTPTVKPYIEERWAELNDTFDSQVLLSVKILEGIHGRMYSLLKSMKPEDFKKTYYHPEHKMNFTLGQLAGMYDWHSRHHLEHLKMAKHNYEQGIFLS